MQPIEQGSQTSQYQDISSTDLPPATTWPASSTIPGPRSMNYDLLGLSLSSPPTQSLFSPYAQTTHQYQHRCQYQGDAHTGLNSESGAPARTAELHGSAVHSPGYGMTVMERWYSEHPSQQGALLAREEYESLKRV